MIKVSDIVNLTNKHISDGNLKIKILSLVKNETDIAVVYTIIRGLVVSVSINDTTRDEKSLAIAAMTGVSSDYESGLEDVTIGLKYINKYWSE